MRKDILKKFLSKNALERLGRIRIVKPQLALQLERYLIQLYQAGKVKYIDDNQMKLILETLSSKKKFRIIK